MKRVANSHSFRRCFVSVPLGLLVGLLFTQPANACMQQRDEVTIFTEEAPARPADVNLVRLFVRIDRTSGKGFLAQPLPPFDTLTDVKRVWISDASTTSDCSRVGPIDRPVWVIGRVLGLIDGTLYVDATPRGWTPRVVRSKGSENWRSYIVDPTLRKLAGGSN